MNPSAERVLLLGCGSHFCNAGTASVAGAVQQHPRGLSVDAQMAPTTHCVSYPGVNMVTLCSYRSARPPRITLALDLCAVA